MYTEGSILFADSEIYDNRESNNGKWRWNQVKELLNSRNSEPCTSNLLSIFDPIKSDDEKETLPMEALGFAKTYINAPDKVAKQDSRTTWRQGILTRWCRAANRLENQFDMCSGELSIVPWG
jgi:POLQ-like helicase